MKMSLQNVWNVLRTLYTLLLFISRYAHNLSNVVEIKVEKDIRD